MWLIELLTIRGGAALICSRAECFLQCSGVGLPYFVPGAQRLRRSFCGSSHSSVPMLNGQILDKISVFEQRCMCLELVTSLFLSIFCCILCCKGYKLVITRALGLHGVYCTQPSGLTPSGFSAIYTIQSLVPML